jgi:hypothetical protein
VIDAAGAIYVIGGAFYFEGTFFNDVWVSTDGGADRAPGYACLLEKFSGRTE